MPHSDIVLVDPRNKFDITSRTWLRNGRIVLPLAIIHSAIYRFLSWHSLYDPFVLQPTWFDRQLPFWPWMVWPYAAMVLVTIIAPLMIRSPTAFRETLLAYALAAGTLFVIYVLLPSRVVREQRPGDGGLTWTLYNSFIKGLGEGATIPSGHIVFPLVMCWGLVRDKSPHAYWIMTATLLASPSILLIKEHVIWDYLAALAIVFIVTRVAKRLPDRM